MQCLISQKYYLQSHCTENMCQASYLCTILTNSTFPLSFTFLQFGFFLFPLCSLLSSCSAFPHQPPCSVARHNAQADHNPDHDVDLNDDDTDEDDRDVLLFCLPCSGGRAGRANA